MVIRRLHHVGVLTCDADATVARYRSLLGAPLPLVSHVVRPAFSLWTAMVAAGAGSGSFVQVIQPEAGPGVAELERYGEGALFEVAFEVDDIAAAAAECRALGLTPRDLVGEELESDYLVASSGNRYFYLAAQDAGGTRVEFIQVRLAGDHDS